MKNVIFVLSLVFISFMGHAQDKNKKLSFEVDGRCQMCKERIEKAVLKVSGVKFANWDIPSHELSLVIDERKTNSMQVKMALAKVGHDSKELKATQEAYDNLHPCCKYRKDSSDDSDKHEG